MKKHFCLYLGFFVFFLNSLHSNSFYYLSTMRVNSWKKVHWVLTFLHLYFRYWFCWNSDFLVLVFNFTGSEQQFQDHWKILLRTLYCPNRCFDFDGQMIQLPAQFVLPLINLMPPRQGFSDWWHLQEQKLHQPQRFFTMNPAANITVSDPSSHTVYSKSDDVIIRIFYFIF